MDVEKITINTCKVLDEQGKEHTTFDVCHYYSNNIEISDKKNSLIIKNGKQNDLQKIYRGYDGTFTRYSGKNVFHVNEKLIKKIISELKDLLKCLKGENIINVNINNLSRKKLFDILKTSIKDNKALENVKIYFTKQDWTITNNIKLKNIRINNTKIENSNITNDEESFINDSIITNSGLNNIKISNTTIENSNITNDEVKPISNSVIKNSKKLKNIEISNSTIGNSNITNVKDCFINSSTITNSGLNNIEISNSTIGNSNITNDKVSSISNSVIKNSKKLKNISGSNYEINTNLDLVNITSSSNVSEKTIINNSKLKNIKISNTTIENSNITNDEESFINDSTINNSGLNNIAISNTTIENSNITNDEVRPISNSVIKNSKKLKNILGSNYEINTNLDLVNITSSSNVSEKTIINNSGLNNIVISNTTIENSNITNDEVGSIGNSTIENVKLISQNKKTNIINSKLKDIFYINILNNGENKSSMIKESEIFKLKNFQYIQGNIEITNSLIDSPNVLLFNNDNEFIEINNSTILEDASIFNDAKITNFKLSGNSTIFEQAKLNGQSDKDDESKVAGYAKIFEKAKISGKPKISGFINIYGESEISDEPTIYGKVNILDDARVSGKSIMKKEEIINKYEERFE